MQTIAPTHPGQVVSETFQGLLPCTRRWLPASSSPHPATPEGRANLCAVNSVELTNGSQQGQARWKGSDGGHGHGLRCRVDLWTGLQSKTYPPCTLTCHPGGGRCGVFPTLHSNHQSICLDIKLGNYGCRATITSAYVPPVVLYANHNVMITDFFSNQHPSLYVNLC